jgi:predicted metal-dependent HD superfamily phosphohydrolase
VNTRLIALNKLTRDALQQRWMEFANVHHIKSAAEVWATLDAGYSGADRHYHNWSHISDSLAKLDDLHELAEDPGSLEAAMWFHDVVYDSHRSDNEERSALLAQSCLAHQPDLARAPDMIRATAHAGVPDNQDAALLCDIDLSILASEQERYDQYADAIRQEYAWVSDDDFKAGRSRVLQAFLSRAAIYTFPECRTRWEAQARLNLKRELLLLGAYES